MQPLRANEAQVLVDAKRGNVVDFSFESDLDGEYDKQGGVQVSCTSRGISPRRRLRRSSSR